MLIPPAPSLQLVGTSNPTPRPAFYDERTSFDRLRLSSTLVLGHGHGASVKSSDDPDDDDSGTPTGSSNRRHILITGGFGSLGKHVVRDLLLGLSAHKGHSSSGADEWSVNSSKNDEEDILLTILDIKDRSSELNHLLLSVPIAARVVVKGTDPRAQAFASNERTVSSFKRKGKLRIILGDVRDEDLLAHLLAPSSQTEATPAQDQSARQADDPGLRRPLLKNHVAHAVVIPPVSGIIHLAAYSPSACRLNPLDCEDVETAGMQAILKALARDAPQKPATGGGYVMSERPWMLVSRRGEAWAEVSLHHCFGFERLLPSV